MWAIDIKYGYIAGSDRTFYIVNYFDSIEEAKAALSDWEDFYNNRRLHWGLKLKTPRQAYKEYISKTETVKEKAS